MSPGNSAVQPASDTQPIAASKRIPTRNLAAYDHYLCAEAKRLAAVGNDQLRPVLATYRSAFSLDPDFAEAHAGYALAAISLWQRSIDSPLPSIGACAEADNAAGRALQLDPGNAHALIVLSLIQAQDGARTSALTTARRAVAAQPDSAEARANLSLILAYGGNTTEARAVLTQLQRLDPVPRSEWYLIFGQVAFADGRYDAAIADFVAVWPTLPQNALLLEHLAAAMAFQGRLRQANQMKGRLLAVMPNANLHLIARRYALCAWKAMPRAASPITATWPWSLAPSLPATARFARSHPFTRLPAKSVVRAAGQTPESQFVLLSADDIR